MKRHRLTLPKSVYRRELIARAVKDYGHICRIRLTEHAGAVFCDFLFSIADMEVTMGEFCNYLVELHNTRQSG